VDLFSRTLEALDWAYVAEALAGHARTAPGRRAAAAVGFLSDVSAITECFDAIDEVLGLEGQRIGAPPVGGL
jgi:dsDNA-specific endonuclease/ATPase MutS2